MSKHGIYWVAVVILSALQSAWGFYNPQTGRWPNRDPIGERIDYVVYSFVRNDPIRKIDLVGLATTFSLDCQSKFTANPVAPPANPPGGPTPHTKTAGLTTLKDWDLSTTLAACCSLDADGASIRIMT